MDLAVVELQVREAARRGVGDLQYYNGEVHRAMFALPNYIRKIVA